MVGPVASFGWQLYPILMKLGLLAGKGGSFISPLSIYLALVLALNGADLDSKTHIQLWPVLRATQSNEDAFNTDTSALMHALTKRQQQGTDLVLANAIFTKELAVKPAYKTSMKALYEAEATEVSGADDINAWAKRVTNGLVPQAVPPGMNNFKAVLANALYFLGAWDWPFEVDMTAKANFVNAQGDTVQVDMMKQNWFSGRRVLVDGRAPERPAQFTEGGAFRGIKLPYKNSYISAIALLPNPERFTNSEVDRALSRIDPSKLLRPKVWRNWQDAHPSLQVALPRFNVSTKQLRLAKALKGMGATAMFSQGFGRITDEDLKVSEVLHSAVVRVNKEGTEAAAVTTVVMPGSGWNPDTTEPFVFNRPFIFIIVDEGDGSRPWTPLFLGTVKDPTAGPS